MAIDTKHKDLEGLRIDRSAATEPTQAPLWARMYILIGIAVLVLLGIAALIYLRVTGREEWMAKAQLVFEQSGSSH